MGEVKALLGSILGIIILGIILSNANAAGNLITDTVNALVSIINAFSSVFGGPQARGMSAAGAGNPGSAAGSAPLPNSGGTGGVPGDITPTPPPSVPSPGANNGKMQAPVWMNPATH